MQSKNIAIKKIIEMPKEQVLKVLIFMAGMEAGNAIKEKNKNEELFMKNSEKTWGDYLLWRKEIQLPKKST